MPLARRLHLDDVVTSFPELGPTVPDGGYSWVVLFGVFLVQMTIPSVLSMYGVVLGYMGENEAADFDIWNVKLILTPILFTAFWNLADPWTRMIVSMATIPRLVGVIGVALLSVGIIASGYLATGGVGAYLASSSAGAVMGIGASFVVTLSDHVLRKYFRKKLLLALTLRNVGASFGLVLIPAMTNLLLHEAKLKAGLLLMTIVLLPTAVGTLTFRLPPSSEHASPYSLLLSTEEDNELPVRISSDAPQTSQRQNNRDDLPDLEYSETEDRIHGGGLFSEGSNIYAYQEPEGDVELFVNPVVHSNGKWHQQLRVLKTIRFWAAVIGWSGMKASTLFFWISLPALSLTIKDVTYFYGWMAITIAAGVGTFLPNLASYKVLKATSQSRRLYFGIASWLCGFTLIGLTYATNYSWIMIGALSGGICIGSLLSCQDLALYDVLGAEAVRCIYKGFSTLVGLCILVFCFIHSMNFCLRLAASLQFFGGFYWILTPTLNIIKATRYRPSHTMTERAETRHN